MPRTGLQFTWAMLRGSVLAIAGVAVACLAAGPVWAEAESTAGTDRTIPPGATVSPEESAPQAPPPAVLPNIFPDRIPVTLTPQTRYLPRVPPAKPAKSNIDSSARSTAKPTPADPASRAGEPLELRTRASGFEARLGSQAARGGGVLGRYDGVRTSAALGEVARLDVVGGFPMAAANDSRFDPTRSFYALSVDLAPSIESLTGRVFSVQQRLGSEAERRAIGGEFGFDHSLGFGLLTLDYDLSFGELGAVSLVSTARLDERTTLSAFVGSRRYTTAQPLFASLQAQSVTSIDQLLEKLSQTEVRAPSFDTSAERRTIRLGAARQIGAGLKVSADLALESVIPETVRGSRANGGAEPTEQLDYALRATWKDFLIDRSATTAVLRVGARADSRRYTGSLGGQYPLLGNLRMGPELAFEAVDTEDALTYKPSLRFEYLRTRLRLDLRVGLELRDEGMGRAGLERRGTFYRFGYSYDF